MSFTLAAGDLDRIVTFQRPVDAGGFKNAGKENWQTIDNGEDVCAQVQEMLPSRGERMVGELKVALRPTRIRIRYRDDISADMRILYGNRVMEMMAPPIELGRREGLELLAQDFSTSGNAA
jgi:head-tail adaptor